jgi:hypothetical protein
MVESGMPIGLRLAGLGETLRLDGSAPSLEKP